MGFDLIEDDKKHCIEQGIEVGQNGDLLFQRGREIQGRRDSIMEG